MRTYRGSRAGERIVVLVTEDDGVGKALPIGPSQLIANHADEFGWGYLGSGPAQLAVALLAHHTGATPLDKRPDCNTASAIALKYYEMFKLDVVATFGDQWTLTSAQIDGWLRAKVNQHATKKTTYSHEPQFPKELGGKQT
jgi:hypothetical protein